jgi:BirA family biotin operon repressor/biotin-[acetyl-CoA-carboxylase] ligase
LDFRLIPRDVVDSTNERAFAALERGEARHGDVFWALGQTAGRGRRGAVWHSARGEGLYVSVVLSPGPPPLRPAVVTMAAGIAVHGAVRALGLRDVHLKWPNDLVAGGAKLAGILVETRGLDPARPHYVVGIGVNVRQRAFPPELVAERAVTSLAREGCDVTVERTLEALLRTLARDLERARDPGPELARDYLEATGLRGRPVEVEAHDGSRSGVVRELSLERGLELELAGGARSAIALEHVRAVRLAP